MARLHSNRRDLDDHAGAIAPGRDGGFFGARYFLNLIGPPSAALAAASAVTPMVPALRAQLAPFCHQIVSRSFCVDGKPFGLCARCTGIYAGIAATWLAVGWLARLPARLRTVEAPSYAFALASVLLWAFGIDAGNPERFALGFAFGAGASLLLWRVRRAQLRPALGAGP